MATVLIELHGNPELFTAFIGWVDQMKARLPVMSGAARHGCCSSIALAIGLLLRDIDMMFDLQLGLGPDGNVPEYILTSSLPTSISIDYLLPKCEEIRDVLQKIRRASNGAGASLSGTHSHNPSPRQSATRSTQLLPRASPPHTDRASANSALPSGSKGVTSHAVMSTRSSIRLAEKTEGSQVDEEVVVDNPGSGRGQSVESRTSREPRTRRPPSRYDLNIFESTDARSKRKLTDRDTAGSAADQLPVPMATVVNRLVVLMSSCHDILISFNIL